jgi:hypothetical protein
MNNKELAAAIARDIFALPKSRDDRAQRLAFMGGKYPQAETNMGLGLCEGALADHIAECLDRLSQKGSGR